MRTQDEIVAKICQRFDLPIPQSEEVQRMIGGQSCVPGRDGGCGE